MKNYSIYLILSVAFFSQSIFAQNMKSAKKDYEDYAFISAIENYKSLIKKGYTEASIYEHLGNANYFNANYKEAAQWYQKLLELEKEFLPKDYYYRYAQCLKSIGNYAKSDVEMDKYIIATKEIRGNNYRNNKNYLKKIKERTESYSISKMKINSSGSDFAPSFYKDQLVFASAKDTGMATRRTHEWNNQGFLDIYSIPLENNTNITKKFSRKINTKLHESTSVFTNDGTTMYFTRNNYNNGKINKDNNGVVRLKIFVAKFIEDEWREIRELPFNSDSYSVAHPALSVNEEKLYFASDMPGSIGGADIFYVLINADGSYGDPVNIGSHINTESRETFPFISKNNQLYFSSDGHPGLGGLDVFSTAIEQDNAKVKNLGLPINGSQDDFTFIMDSETNNGYFSSNRDGSDDIYKVKQLDVDNCDGTINLLVTDYGGKPLPFTEVTISDGEGNVVEKGTTEADGVYVFSSSCKKTNYVFIGTKENYEEAIVVGVFEPDVTNDIVLRLPNITFEIGTDLKKELSIDKIYFDLNRHFLRDKSKMDLDIIIRYLELNPSVTIEIRSHTDSRSGDEYNLRLSHKRAKSTANYIIETGITKDRVSYRGYGEIELINKCGNLDKCSEEDHQLNRRSEFIIIRNK